MRVLIASDKFKGSLGAAEVAEAIAAGIADVLPHAEITLLPIADGGEGTAEVICRAARGEWHECEVHDPLGRRVRARYCTIDGGATAVMEMSEASGLWRVPFEKRDPLIASSFGTGEMLLDAARRGEVGKVIIGLGGSATNDGGFGMARALGFRFFDADEQELRGSVADLTQLARIEAPLDLRLPEIIAAVDVRNPLLGDRGATRVFGPQKGATAADLEVLEAALTRLAAVTGGHDRDVPGAGAAGGLGFGLMRFCRASLRSGFEVVAEVTHLEDAVRAADVVITGEGRLDAQTLEGKAPAGVAQFARKHGKRVYAIVGVAKDAPLMFDGVSTLVDANTSAGEAMNDPVCLLRARAGELASTFRR